MNAGRCVLGLGLLLAEIAGAHPLCPAPLRAGWDPWEPYHYADASGAVTGSAAEVLKEVTRRVGCELSFRRNPWARTLADIESGNLDVAMEVQKLSSRARFALFSAPYRRIDVRLWTWRDAVPAPEARDLTSLLAQGVRVGAVTGYAYGETADRLLSQAVKRGQVQFVRADEQNLRKLQDRRLDGFLTDQASAERLAQAARLTAELVAHPKLVLPQDVRLMFSQASVPTALVDEFDRALVDMQADGTLKRLLKRFHPEGAKPPRAREP